MLLVAKPSMHSQTSGYMYHIPLYLANDMTQCDMILALCVMIVPAMSGKTEPALQNQLYLA